MEGKDIMTTITRDAFDLAVRRAYSTGEERGREMERETVLHGLKTVAGLNGSGERVVGIVRKGEGNSERNAWISAKIKKLRDEGKPEKQAAAIAYSMWRRRRLKAFIARVVKSVTWVEGQHPRAKTGEFIKKNEVDDAKAAYKKGDKGPMEALRERVHPDDLDLLNEHLSHEDHAGDARVFHPAAQEAGHLRQFGWVKGAELTEHVGKYLDQIAEHGPLSSDTTRDLMLHVGNRLRSARVGVLHNMARSVGIKRPDLMKKDDIQAAIRNAVKAAVFDAEVAYHGQTQSEGDEFTARQPVTAHKALDAAGHEHRGKGEGGGQFTSGGGDSGHSGGEGPDTPATDSGHKPAANPLKPTMTRKESFARMRDFKREGWEAPKPGGEGSGPKIRMEGGSLTILSHGRYEPGEGYRYSEGFELFQSNDGGARGKVLPKVYATLDDAAAAAESRYKMLVDQGYAPKPEEGTARHAMYQRANESAAADLPPAERDKPHLPDGKPIPEGHAACPKCAGYGNIPTFGHVAEGVCFKCSGSGLMKLSKPKAADPPAEKKGFDWSDAAVDGLLDNYRRQS